MSKFLLNIKSFFLKNKVYFYITLVLIIIVLFSVVFIKKSADQKSDNYGISDNKELLKNCGDNCAFRLLDGVEVEKGRENPFIISAVIDNHDEARPQFSLSKAVLVYDIPAEGGINRYLAFFLSDASDVLEIGPVRSARPYFLTIASEYQSLLLHCGGSPEALATIIKEKKLTLNEFYNSYYFRRYSGFVAPHNVLANFSKIQDYLSEKELLNSNFTSWKFKDAPRSDLSQAKQSNSIKINNGFKDYAIEWVYDTDKNAYFRKLAGRDQIDDSSETVSAKNIIFQFVQTEILDKELRLKIKLVGEGEAVICLDSYCEKGSWKKNSDKDRSIFYYSNGQEVEFNRGKTWIQLLDKNYSLEY